MLRSQCIHRGECTKSFHLRKNIRLDTRPRNQCICIQSMVEQQRASFGKISLRLLVSTNVVFHGCGQGKVQLLLNRTVTILSKITMNPCCAVPPKFCQSRTKFLSGKNFSSDTLLRNLVLSHIAVKVQHIGCYRSLDRSDLLRFADTTKIRF